MYEDQAISNEEATKKFRKFQQLVDIFSLCRFSKYCEKAKKNDELSLCQNYWQISGFGEKTLIRKLVFFVCSITLTFSLVKLVKTFFVMSFKIIGLWITKKARMPKLNPLVHFK